MKRTILMLILLTAGFTLAQDRAAMQAQVEQLSAALSDRVVALREAPAAKALGQAAQAAKADYEATEQGLPGVPELDAEIQQHLERIHALRVKRNALLRKNEALLEAKRRAVEAAEDASANAVFGDAQVKDLIARRQELVRQLEPALPPPAAPALEETRP